MIINLLKIFLPFFLLIFGSPVYSNNISPKIIENYTLKISRKFSKTYCNTIQFGISNDGALKFSIGETNKEFLNNKLNKYIDYQILTKNILLSLKNKCKIDNFPVNKLDNLSFK